jgi:hypothetical protein
MGVNKLAEDALAVPVPPDALAAGLVAVLDPELPQPARTPARTVSSTVRPSLLPLTPPDPRVCLDPNDFGSRPIDSTRPMKVDHVPCYSQ